MPAQGGAISDRIDKVAELLDEMADIINGAIRFQEEIAPIAQTSSNPILNILSAFMSGNTSPPEHGDKTQQTQREIHEVIDPPTL
tara:strand:+ start:70 stop:324 length:255 start_codon:yes stop_codon:yes gene_type:complete